MNFLKSHRSTKVIAGGLLKTLCRLNNLWNLIRYWLFKIQVFKQAVLSRFNFSVHCNVKSNVIYEHSNIYIKCIQMPKIMYTWRCKSPSPAEFLSLPISNPFKGIVNEWASWGLVPSNTNENECYRAANYTKYHQLKPIKLWWY